jgi:hypothetical protein
METVLQVEAAGSGSVLFGRVGQPMGRFHSQTSVGGARKPRLELQEFMQYLIAGRRSDKSFAHFARCGYFLRWKHILSDVFFDVRLTDDHCPFALQVL